MAICFYLLGSSSPKIFCLHSSGCSCRQRDLLDSGFCFRVFFYSASTIGLGEILPCLFSLSAIHLQYSGIHRRRDSSLSFFWSYSETLSWEEEDLSPPHPSFDGPGPHRHTSPVLAGLLLLPSTSRSVKPPPPQPLWTPSPILWAKHLPGGTTAPFQEVLAVGDLFHSDRRDLLSLSTGVFVAGEICFLLPPPVIVSGEICPRLWHLHARLNLVAEKLLTLRPLWLMSVYVTESPLSASMAQEISAYIGHCRVLILMAGLGFLLCRRRCRMKEKWACPNRSE